MTEWEINIAIAKADGWVKEVGCTGIIRWRNKHKLLSDKIPNYCRDLNAMHEAENAFTYEEAQKFEEELSGICGSENLHKEYPLPFEFAVVHATARQRAEAFLRTLGKWKEKA